MSGYDDDRPSKRRRRDHSADSPPARSQRNETTRSRDRSPTFKAQRSRESRDYNSRGERDLNRARDTPGDEERRDRNERQRRSASRERHRETNDRSYRTHDRSSSPRPDRNRRQHQDRDGRRDRDRARSRDKHSRRRDRDRNKTDRGHSPPSPQPFERSKKPLPSQNDAFTLTADAGSALVNPVEKQKPNFGLTGKLAAASNTIQTANQTIVLKYHEPPESRKPPARDQWRLYVFKGDEILDTVELSEQSCWLFGREVAVVDFPLEHQSCSKQHAAIQFRYLEKRNEFGDKIGKVKPYVIDLESANGTSLNEEPVPAAKYVELRDKDVVKFGHSSRDYVIQLPPSK